MQNESKCKGNVKKPFADTIIFYEVVKCVYK